MNVDISLSKRNIKLQDELRIIPSLGDALFPAHVRRRLVAWMIGIGMLGSIHVAAAYEPDVFRTGRNVSPTPSGSLLGVGPICEFGELPQPLSLREVIERTLCNNPNTREAWAQVKEQAASVGASEGAYLPSLTGNWQGVRDDSITNITGEPQLSSANRSFIKTDSVSLSWVLYDFGARGAALDNSRELLAVAQANQNATLQQAFAQAGKDFYSAVAAQGALHAAREVEIQASDSFHAATERVNHGVAPVTDALQAQTSYAQATYNRAKAEGDLQAALGTLAFDMALSPDTPMVLPPVSDGVTPDATFDSSVGALMTEAKRSHPSIIAAEAQVEAAAAKVRETRDQGLPNVQIVGKYDHNNQPASLGLGIPEYPAKGHEWYIGVQVTFPFFEGFTRNYQVRQAEAQVEEQQANLDKARDQVALDVWTSYQALKTATENVDNSLTLLDIAQRSEEAAQERYRAGVGNILELLNAQTALATAKKQRIQALTDWRTARLELGAKLGQLGMQAISLN